MRICIVAEHASRNFGGEAILPVHYFRLLRSLGVESWMVVHARTRNELAELFPDDFDRILFVPDLWTHKLINHLSGYLPRRLSTATLGLLSQLITQLCQKDIVRRLIRDKQVSVIHQPIPVRSEISFSAVWPGRTRGDRTAERRNGISASLSPRRAMDRTGGGRYSRAIR